MDLTINVINNGEAAYSASLTLLLKDGITFVNIKPVPSVSSITDNSVRIYFCFKGSRESPICSHIGEKDEVHTSVYEFDYTLRCDIGDPFETSDNVRSLKISKVQ
jgi:hypothetical protein